MGRPPSMDKAKEKSRVGRRGRGFDMARVARHNQQAQRRCRCRWSHKELADESEWLRWSRRRLSGGVSAVDGLQLSGLWSGGAATRCGCCSMQCNAPIAHCLLPIAYCLVPVACCWPCRGRMAAATIASIGFDCRWVKQWQNSCSCGGPMVCRAAIIPLRDQLLGVLCRSGRGYPDVRQWVGACEVSTGMYEWCRWSSS